MNWRHESVERTVHGLLTIQATLGGPDVTSDMRNFGEKTIARFETYFADHMEEVLEAHERTRDLKDDESQAAVFTYLDALLTSYQLAAASLKPPAPI